MHVVLQTGHEKQSLLYSYPRTVLSAPKGKLSIGTSDLQLDDCIQVTVLVAAARLHSLQTHCRIVTLLSILRPHRRTQ